jgi:hypothetical protein
VQVTSLRYTVGQKTEIVFTILQESELLLQQAYVGPLGLNNKKHDILKDTSRERINAS